MKTFVCAGFILLLVTQSYAETYSWVDDSGTYNFTEDYSRVPKKYRKKVKHRDDIRQDVPQESPKAEKSEKQAEKFGTKAAVSAEGGLYGGKSRAEWRTELDAREAELSGIEQRMEQMRKQSNNPKGISRAQFDVLKKEYDDTRATYDQKYKSYTELIETIRKAGLPVDIKK
ncbi:MAG: hypothetical protein A2076_07595 [Geobacteraceae bacterium GWC2_53_11]|nr:MAG: hypothetical protein A2076_07595 [Geobacteraceae bacterium GWC2_53_11]